MPAAATPNLERRDVLAALSPDESSSVAFIRRRLRRKGYAPSDPALWQMLRTLSLEGLVESCREGRYSLYRLTAKGEAKRQGAGR